jgi:hypothetical protein
LSCARWGKDPEGDRESYWSKRQPPGPAPQTRISFEGCAVDFLTELWRFMRVRKKFWLLPIVLMMAVFGGLVLLSQGSAVAPFIYTLF